MWTSVIEVASICKNIEWSLMMYRSVWGAWVCPQCVWLCGGSVRYRCLWGREERPRLSSRLSSLSSAELRFEAVQFPKQAVMQLLGMLSIVPLCNVVRVWEMGFQPLQKINMLLVHQGIRCSTVSLMFSKEWSLCADLTCSTPERRPCTIHGQFVQQCCHFLSLGTGPVRANIHL